MCQTPFLGNRVAGILFYCWYESCFSQAQTTEPPNPNASQFRLLALYNKLRFVKYCLMEFDLSIFRRCLRNLASSALLLACVVPIPYSAALASSTVTEFRLSQGLLDDAYKNPATEIVRHPPQRKIEGEAVAESGHHESVPGKAAAQFDADRFVTGREHFEREIELLLFENSEKRSGSNDKAGPFYRDYYPVPDIPILSNKKIESLIKFYTVKKRKLFQLAVKRSAKYMKMINRIFREYGLPDNLAYLAVVESNLNPRAVSRANAIGLWQFMRSTGRLFDLHGSWWHDDRYDPEKSTVAAAKFLKHLHRRFGGDWELAMAAYNSGSGRVGRAQKRAKRQGKPQSFWYLDLPRETRGYVPAFYAVATVFANLEAYGFTETPIRQEAKTPKNLQVSGGLFLKQIAKTLDIEHGELTRLNPSLSKDMTPAIYDSYGIRIPAHTKITASQREKLHLLEKRRHKFWKRYTVRKGDSLWLISRQYRIPIAQIRTFNRFRRKNLLKIGQRIMLPLPVAAQPSKRGKTAANLFALAKNRLDKMPGTTHTHRIKKGDTLWNISQKFNVSIKSIRKWNRTILRRRTLQIGTRILIKLPLKLASKAPTAVSI